MNKQQYLSLIKIRENMFRTIRQLFYENGWLEVTTSTITPLTGTCETIATLARLPFFDRTAHLSQTAQLQLEYIVKMYRRKVWTLDHSFRMEHRLTDRHLVEFTLVEAEAPNFELEDIISWKQRIVKEVVSSSILQRKEELEEIGADLDYLENLRFPFRVLRYDEAIGNLQSEGIDIKWGDDLGYANEVNLLKLNNLEPLFITHYPSDIKYFNMKRTKDRKYVYSIDLLAPPFGEISGGAVREHEFEKVKENLLTSKMWKDIHEQKLEINDFNWYLDLWKQGSPGPRGGFGVGFERLVGFITRIDKISNCIEFPRTRDLAYP
jgi:asparaginyl-tRNA synthetase